MWLAFMYPEFKIDSLNFICRIYAQYAIYLWSNLATTINKNLIILWLYLFKYATTMGIYTHACFETDKGVIPRLMANILFKY